MKKTRFIILAASIILCISGCGNNTDSNKNMEENTTENLQDTSISDKEVESTDWIADLNIAQEANQILIVAAEGSTANISLHNKNENDVWEEVLIAEASIGKNGVGKNKEGDGKTPTGIYHFMFGFGIKENPGTVYEYIQVDENYYWVDDSDSQYYNQFVNIKDVTKDWDSAEHIVSADESYHYVLAIDYNTECIPGMGSAIFMHCKPTGGAGCIAVSEEVMIEIMQMVQNGCVIIIDDKDNIYNY